MLANLPLILSSVSLNALAQIFLRKGMLSLGSVGPDAAQILRLVPRLALNAYILGGMLSYALSIGLWLAVLSRVEVSLAYPFLSIGYLITAAAGLLFLGEAVTPVRLAGIACICLGVALISRS